MQFPGATSRERFHEALRALIDQLVSGLIEGTVEAARASGAGSVEDVRRHLARMAAFTGPAQATNRQLKRLLHGSVYSSHALAEERRSAARMIGEVFARFIERPDLLPEHYRRQLDQAPPHRVVCDYIAGMTDAFFLRAHARLFNLPEP